MPAKILVVDDEPDLELLIRQRFRRQIRNGEFVFVFARNGIEALQRLQESPDVDIVLTDINMPEMDGLTLLIKLGELDLLLKSVIVSAYGDMENIRLAMHRGAADFLTKPIDLTDMEITVNKLMEEVQVLKEAMKEHDQLLALRRELEIASSIQQSILPQTFPPFPGRADFAIFAEMIPAREVGGDLYDFFLIDDHHLGFVVGDVSGKGVPAAIFMAVTRTVLKATALQGMTPGECLRHVNSVLCLDNRAELFVTIFYGILDTHSGEVAYSSGGHNPPFVLRDGGEVVALESTGGTVLGVLENIAYGTKTVRLEPGAAIFLYTDGVTEAMDVDGQLFSEARLRELLHGVERNAPQHLVEAVVAAVKRHCGSAAQSDDIAALAITYTPGSTPQ